MLFMVGWNINEDSHMMGERTVTVIEKPNRSRLFRAEMLYCLILAVACVCKGSISEKPSLIPKKVDVLENNSVVLTCTLNSTKTENVSRWTKSGDINWVPMVLSNNGSCDMNGYLDDRNLYAGECHKNNSFALTLLKVDEKNHGQNWTCRVGFVSSNDVTIKVKVPVKTVNISTPSESMITFEENKYYLFTCVTSYSRPTPLVKWFLQVAFNVHQINATTSDVLIRKDGFESARSSLNISFNRNKNEAELFCTGSNEIREEKQSRYVTLNVTYAPKEGPTIHGMTNGSTYVVRENIRENLTCSILWGNPLPHLSWNCSGKTAYSTIDGKAVQLTLHLDTKRDTDRTCACKSTHIIAGIQTTLVRINILYPPVINNIKLWYSAEHQHINISMTEAIRVTETESFSLKCEATSNPDSSYLWSGEKTSDTSILAFENISTRPRFTIACQARNVMEFRNGSTEIGHSNRSVTVDVLYAPNIGQLNDASAIEGTDVTLTCPFTPGNPTKTTITWTRVSGEPQLVGKNLTISNVSRNDSMVYTCTVNNTMIMTGDIIKEGRNSRNIFFDVLYPPNKPMFLLVSVSENDVNKSIDGVLSIVEDKPLSLTCEASSRPSPTLYLWTWKGTFNNSVLRIPRLSRNDPDKVTCQVSNNMIPTNGVPQTGHNSNTLSLNVLYPPVIDPMRNISAVEGSRATLSCPVSHGNPNNTIITWTSENGDKQWSGPVFTLQNVSRNDSMVYTCTVNNAMVMTGGKEVKGNDSRNVHLDVMYKARIINYQVNEHDGSDSVTVSENQNVTFICEVEGNPVPSGGIYNHNQLDIGDGVTDTKKSVRFSAVFVATCLHKGVYVCKGFNKIGNAEEADIILQVTCSPRPDASVQIQEVIKTTEHVPVSLDFIATAYPTTTSAVWKRFNGTSWINVNTTNKIKTDQLGLNFSLTILDVSKSDFGKYKLRINNTVGFYEQIFRVEHKAMISAPNEPDERKTSNTIGIAVGVSGAIVVIATIIGVSICLYRKRNGTIRGKRIYQNVIFNDKNLKMKRKAKTIHKEDLQELDDVPHFTNEPAEYSNTLDNIERIDRIKVEELFSYVSEKSEDSFGVDYQKLPQGLQKPCTFARKPENIALNRYNGIYPYDDSRVKLHGHPDFFINACYIDGYKRCNAYIASLGPTAKTTGDFVNFWQMIWHERSDIIVMLTNLLEPSGMKCEQYWPKDGDRMFYGDFSVSSQKTEVFAEYTVRTLSVSKDNDRRIVTHLHYTAWPDKKVPEDTTSLLEFRERMKRTHTLSEGPIVVHCSAGIGRTGTLIAVDRLIAEGQDVGSVDVLECVTSMREQRVKMVQTMEQYVYIYKALANALTFDQEIISVENITGFVATTNSNLYSKQFQQLKQSVEADSKEVKEARVVNGRLTNKNREGTDIPDDRFRVMLHLSREEDDSDYINAVYSNSFKKRDYFITAQTPLPNTVADFICMVYQNECTCIVTMDDFKEPEMTIGEYLPKERNALSFGQFTVFSSILEKKHQYVVRKMKIKYNGKFESGEKVVYHFQYTKWMQKNETPTNAGEFVQFVKDVEDYASELGDERLHVLVHCLKANERCGLFCAVTILMEKIKFEGHISVLSTLRHLRTRRRSAITSMDQLRFCYQAVSAFVKLYRL